MGQFLLHILRRRGGTKKCVFRPQILFEFRIFRCWTRVIYDRVQNGKKYFEIDVFSNFEWVTSRAGNSNENRWNFEFFRSWYSSFNWQKGRNFKIICPLPYPIKYLHDPGLNIEQFRKNWTQKLRRRNVEFQYPVTFSFFCLLL